MSGVPTSRPGSGEDGATVWRIEYRLTNGGGGSPGRFEREYLESDQEAHLRLMELEVDATLSDTSGMNRPAKRRARAWLRKRQRPVVEGAQEYAHACHIKAWKMVDGEWRGANWSLVEPSIEVQIGGPTSG